MNCPHTAEEPTSTSQASPALPAARLPPSPQNSLPLTAAPAQTSHTPAPSPTSPNSTPSSPEETLAEIVLLMDSNGKFVQDNKRFPRHKMRKITETTPRTSTLDPAATATAPPTSMPTTFSAAQTTPAQL
ncbi:unnamed protein product [Coregonus sp. 'balchen']|nr:unnamed protein product [Coregonus sp. 'balchen']